MRDHWHKLEPALLIYLDLKKDAQMTRSGTKQLEAWIITSDTLSRHLLQVDHQLEGGKLTVHDCVIQYSGMYSAGDTAKAPWSQHQSYSSGFNRFIEAVEQRPTGVGKSKSSPNLTRDLHEKEVAAMNHTRAPHHEFSFSFSCALLEKDESLDARMMVTSLSSRMTNAPGYALPSSSYLPIYYK
jgi:hypothetical protein